MQVNLSDSEWKLMNRLWEQSPRTIMDLTASLKEDTGWSKNTVITMLARLEAKGAVRHEEGGRAKRYFPAVDREDGAAAETNRIAKAAPALAPEETPMMSGDASGFRKTVW